MKNKTIYSVSVEVHYEGVCSEYVYLTKAEAVRKFNTLVKKQESATTVRLVKAALGKCIHNEGTPVMLSRFEYRAPWCNARRLR